ncbi:MAG: response regulator [Acidimicrobiales bacterium]
MTPNGTSSVIRIGVVDDQELVRTGFRMILESEDDFEVVGEAADGRAALDMVRANKPDVVLMDVRMPVMDGVEATRQLENDRDTRVIIVTTFDLDEYVFAALRHGASGFLLKDAPADQLVEAIRVVAAGEALLSPSVTKRLIERFQTGVGPADAAEPDGANAVLSSLTEREGEVLGELAKGLSNAEIASKLFVSETTVKTHVGRVLTKLNVRDRVQAVVVAYESGVVRPGTG